MSQNSTAPKFKRIKSNLMAIFLIISLTPMLIVGYFFLRAHSLDLTEQSTQYLIAARNGASQKVSTYFNNLDAEVVGFVHSELAYSSGGRFYGLIDAFRRLGENVEESREIGQKRYVPGSGDAISQPTTRKSANYVGVERYRLIHTRYQNTFLDLLKRSDFDDILLVDLDGNVAYSALKNDYYATNLDSGRYHDSELGKLFEKLKGTMSNKQKDLLQYNDLVLMSDFSSSTGKDINQKVVWFAAPIIQQGYLHSYAFARLPIEKLSNLIESDPSKNVSILLMDQHQNLLAGSSDHLKDVTALSQSKPEADITQYVDDNNETIMASFAPVMVHDMQWSVFSQSPEDLAFARVSNLQMLFIGIVVVALVLVFITSAYLSNLITRPLLKLTWAAERISAGHLEEKVEGAEREDEIGRLAVSFERMQRSVREKIELIEKQNQELEFNLQTIAEQNKELQLADKLKDDFLATTSHELRTPLHGMIGVAQTLLSGAHGDIPGAQRFQLEIIINSGNRLSNLVDDLLDYHKMRYGDLKLDQHAVSVASSAQLVVELSNHLIEDKPVRLLNHIDPRLPLVSADPQRLEQVLYNLIGNAIKFTNEGKVVLNAAQKDDRLFIEVIDTGRGIPEHDLETIFEPLMQSQSARYQHGTGLGLSISKRLIELMEGELTVSSQPLLGTTFTLSLPLASEEQLKEQVEGTHFKGELTPELNLSEETTVLPENPEGKLILVADDEPVNLKILESFLRLEGYRVKCVSDGQQALDMVKEQKPAILLLDIMMPELTGYEVCERLRAQYSRHELPIIMLTALNQTEDKIKGFECGANDYLVKPFNKQELSARIGVHIDASVSEERKQQNLVLTQELSQMEQTEAILLDTQTRLLEQLENTPEAIVCINDKHKISYANQTATQLFKRSIEQLKRSSIEEFIAPKYLSFEQPHRSVDIDIFINEEKQVLPSDIFTLPLETGMRGMFIFNNDPHKVNQRVADLEVALDAMSHYAFAGDKTQLDLIRELGGDFSKLVEKVEGDKNGKQQALRQLLVECMSLAVEYWESHDGQTKFTFAEQSGLWRVYLDRSTLQTRTLDKYLRVETLPKTPRWRTVLNSLDYILSHTERDDAQRAQLFSLRDQLQHQVTNG